MKKTIDVLFDHPDFLIVNKPSGIAVQNDTDQSGILPILCQQLNLDRLWLVHRLDRVTSGVLILAKHAQAAAIFGQMFEQKNIDKYYLAISNKKPKKKQGTVKGGMKKVRDGKWMLDHSHENFAYTQFFSYSITPGMRLFLVKPLTGKTHQIRVALKSVGSPILGDPLYANEDADRTYLHAYCIRFTYQNSPITVISAPTLGEYFVEQKFKERLQQQPKPWTLNWPNHHMVSATKI